MSIQEFFRRATPRGAAHPTEVFLHSSVAGAALDTIRGMVARADSGVLLRELPDPLVPPNPKGASPYVAFSTLSSRELDILAAFQAVHLVGARRLITAAVSSNQEERSTLVDHLGCARSVWQRTSVSQIGISHKDRRLCDLIVRSLGGTIGAHGGLADVVLVPPSNVKLSARERHEYAQARRRNSTILTISQAVDFLSGSSPEARVFGGIRLTLDASLKKDHLVRTGLSVRLRCGLTSRTLRKDHTSHWMVQTPIPHEKLIKAREWSVCIVSEAWVRDCVAQSKILPSDIQAVPATTVASSNSSSDRGTPAFGAARGAPPLGPGAASTSIPGERYISDSLYDVSVDISGLADDDWVPVRAGVVSRDGTGRLLSRAAAGASATMYKRVGDLRALGYAPMRPGESSQPTDGEAVSLDALLERVRGRFPTLAPPCSLTPSCNSIVGGERCSICHELFLTSQACFRLRCHHLFHVGCIAAWLLRDSSPGSDAARSCPLCRVPVTPTGDEMDHADPRVLTRDALAASSEHAPSRLGASDPSGEVAPLAVSKPALTPEEKALFASIARSTPRKRQSRKRSYRGDQGRPPKRRTANPGASASLFGKG